MGRVTAKHFCLLPVFFLLIPLLSSRSAENDQGSAGLKKDAGKVVAVYDGDTIKVRFSDGSEHKVRMIGTDTPEMDETREEVRLEARLARRFVFYYLYQKPVELTYERELKDKYGRLLAYVWTEKGLFNEFILERGFARVFWAFPYDLKERFIRAQHEARKNERGFWQKKPYPLVSGSEIREHIGRLRRVRFVCGQMKRRGNFLFLYPEPREFSVLIPKKSLPSFPEWKSWEKCTIEVSGFLEEYKGQPQIMAFFPLQLKVLEQK